MRFLVVICVFLISMLSTASAQPNKRLSRAHTKEAERLLHDLGYWTGPVDGVFDLATRSALVAFQKWEGRPISGSLSLQEIDAIRNSVPPKGRELGYEHVEIDIDRQVLLLISQEGNVKVLPVSTGSGEPFIDEGETSVAYTPRGRFIVYDKIVGWEYGPIGPMYYSNYISGGVAIHGSRSVPISPRTHGCIRIPMYAAVAVSKLMPKGTIVLVYDKVSFVSAKSWVENPKLKPVADIE